MGDHYVVLSWNGYTYDDSEVGVDGVYDTLADAIAHCQSEPTPVVEGVSIDRAKCYSISHYRGKDLVESYDWLGKPANQMNWWSAQQD